MSATIRGATPSDVDAIALIHVRSWRKAYPDVVPSSVLEALSPQERAEEWRAALGRAGRDGDTTLVAERDGQILGFASGGPARDAGLEGLAEVYAIYLDPQHWGHGLGGALLDALLGLLADMGFAEAVLWVFEANRRGRAFYERRGWTPDGASDPLILDGVPVPALRYRRPLP